MAIGIRKKWRSENFRHEIVYQPHLAIELLVANNGRANKPCPGLRPPKAGANGQPLQGLCARPSLTIKVDPRTQ